MFLDSNLITVPCAYQYSYSQKISAHHVGIDKDTRLLLCTRWPKSVLKLAPTQFSTPDLQRQTVRVPKK